MLAARAAAPAFHPAGKQRILQLGDAVFALIRAAPDGAQEVCCLHNVTARPQAVTLDWPAPPNTVDLITVRPHPYQPGRALRLEPYQSLWLAPV